MSVKERKEKKKLVLETVNEKRKEKRRKKRRIKNASICAKWRFNAKPYKRKYGRKVPNFVNLPYIFKTFLNIM